MPSRPRARSPLAIAVVTLLIVGAQLAWAATAPCGSGAAAERAAPCRCCPSPADGEREAPASDATITARCCAMDAGSTATPPPEPVVRTPPVPAAIAPPAIALAAVGPRHAVAARPAPVVIARAVGPPLWLTTRSLRL